MTITLDSFLQSLSEKTPPAITPELEALWWTHQNEWERAHRIVQDRATPEAAWVHAHLHRVEGDESNARYWYARAGKPACTLPLSEEWRAIVTALLV